MAMNLEALKAKLRAQKEAANNEAQSATNLPVSTSSETNNTSNDGSSGINTGVTEPDSVTRTNVYPEPVQQQATTTEVTIGTARTSEIDHLTFMSNMTELKEAIHHQHPHMPVLLMKIHKHLREDPELVTTLAEEDIGTIVEGLKIQTKTELVGTIAKQAKSRDKKTKLDVDMF